MFTFPGRVVRPVVHIKSNRIEWIGPLMQPWAAIACFPYEIEESKRLRALHREKAKAIEDEEKRREREEGGGTELSVREKFAYWKLGKAREEKKKMAEEEQATADNNKDSSGGKGNNKKGSSTKTPGGGGREEKKGDEFLSTLKGDFVRMFLLNLNMWRRGLPPCYLSQRH